MNVSATIPVEDIFQVGVFGHDQIELMKRTLGGPQVSEIRHTYDRLVQSVQAGTASEQDIVIAGITAYFFGDQLLASELLAGVSNNAMAAYYAGVVSISRGLFEEAEKQFQHADKLGYDHVECVLRMAETKRCMSQLDEAEQLIRSVATQGAGRAEYSYQMGCICADRGDTYGAVEYFERAVDMDSRHSQALFRLANECNLRGDDDRAIRLYEQSLSSPPFFLGALLNLGLLYEDRESYGPAAFCFRRILEYDPNHAQAAMYLKDIEAAGKMFYDEEAARTEAQMRQLLCRPISDFELSVRSRNCLQAMNIQTLEDLTRISEEELLRGKNFGQTSLDEIRELMQAHSLRIGQDLHKSAVTDHVAMLASSPQMEALLNRPISDLNLSVRARKCMVRLGITTLGELCSRTADELLSSRNFGVTSLNEVREKLTEHELKLRND